MHNFTFRSESVGVDVSGRTKPKTEKKCSDIYHEGAGEPWGPRSATKAPQKPSDTASLAASH
jgi:hypothetical protein